MDPDEYDAYFTQEGCPDLALVVHERTGHPIAILFDDGTTDDWGRGPEPVPAHVFVTCPDTGDALDVRGRRPVREVLDDFYDLEDPCVRQVSDGELRAMMGDDRPFYAPCDEVRSWAISAARHAALID